MQYRLCLTLRSSVAEVERLSREFGLFADRHNLSKEVRFAVNLALEEAVMNVIMHGSKGRADQPIGVEVVVGAGEVTAQVEDGRAGVRSVATAAPGRHRRPPGTAASAWPGCFPLTKRCWTKPQR